MKQIVTIIAVLLMGYAASAQTLVHTDTLTNAATVSNALSSVYLKDIETFTIGATLTRLSGTAAGTVILKGSLDGTNYTTMECPCSFANSTAVTDSAAISNTVTQTFFWNCTGKRLAKALLELVGSGTQSVQVKTYAIKN